MERYLKGKLLDLVVAGDRQAANDLIAEWANVHGYDRAVTEILEPTLRLLGERWATTEDLSLAHGYIAGKIAEDVMEKAAALQAEVTGASAPKGAVVIGNIEDDCHALGRKLVVTFLRAAGWDVFDLGNDVLAAEFVNKAIEVNAHIIGASAMMYTTAMNIKKLREEINNRGLKGKVQLAVGGAVFVQRPELVEQVGGDGTARNAIAAIDLMERLLSKGMGR